MKNIQQMNRTEVIKELSGLAHPSWFHSLLEWETPQLVALLAYYRSGGKGPFPSAMVGKIYRTRGVGDPLPVSDESVFIGIDFGYSHPQISFYVSGKQLANMMGAQIVRQLKVKRESTHG